MVGREGGRRVGRGSGVVGVVLLWLQFANYSIGQVYLQQNKKKAEAKGENCHAKTMWSLEKPI